MFSSINVIHLMLFDILTLPWATTRFIFTELTHFILSVRNSILSFNFSNFSLLSMAICCCYCYCSSSTASAAVWKSVFYSQVLYLTHLVGVALFPLLLLMLLLLLCYGFERSLLTLGCFLTYTLSWRWLNLHLSKVDNRKKDILILGEGLTDGLNDTTITSEAEYFINISNHKNKTV